MSGPGLTSASIEVTSAQTKIRRGNYSPGVIANDRRPAIVNLIVQLSVIEIAHGVHELLAPTTAGHRPPRWFLLVRRSARRGLLWTSQIFVTLDVVIAKIIESDLCCVPLADEDQQPRSTVAAVCTAYPTSPIPAALSPTNRAGQLSTMTPSAPRSASSTSHESLLMVPGARP